MSFYIWNIGLYYVCLCASAEKIHFLHKKITMRDLQLPTGWQCWVSYSKNDKKPLIILLK